MNISALIVKLDGTAFRHQVVNLAGGTSAWNACRNARTKGGKTLTPEQSERVEIDDDGNIVPVKKCNIANDGVIASTPTPAEPENRRIQRELISEKISDGYEKVSDGNVTAAARLMLMDLHYLMSLPGSHVSPSTVVQPSQSARDAAREIVGPYAGAVECPWCRKHDHRDPCCFSCGQARAEIQCHEQRIAEVTAIISKHCSGNEVEQALIELREMWPRRGRIVRNSNRWLPTAEKPELEIEVSVYGLPLFTGKTLDEAMNKARFWHKRRQKK